MDVGRRKLAVKRDRLHVAFEAVREFFVHDLEHGFEAAIGKVLSELCKGLGELALAAVLSGFCKDHV